MPKISGRREWTPITNFRDARRSVALLCYQDFSCARMKKDQEMQIDRDTDKFLPCKCGRTPTRFSIGYGRKPYYMHCDCGKRMGDGMGGHTDTFIECWNRAVRHMEPGSYTTNREMLDRAV